MSKYIKQNKYNKPKWIYLAHPTTLDVVKVHVDYGNLAMLQFSSIINKMVEKIHNPLTDYLKKGYGYTTKNIYTRFKNGSLTKDSFRPVSISKKYPEINTPANITVKL